MDKLVMMLLGLLHVVSTLATWEGCGGRLERALDAMQKESIRRNRREDDDQGVIYQRRLTSAPLEITVAHVIVKVPQIPEATRDGSWARVERCHFEPTNNSLRSRVMLNDLSVSGLVSLMPSDSRVPPVGETCRMTLRIRRAGIEFNTTPIARTRGQMRIRTESSFLEPRFASIFAYGCRPIGRVDRQIKRQDKPSPTGGVTQYEEAEPRHQEFEHSSKEEDIVIANESATSHIADYARYEFSPTRKTFWITKLPEVKRKRRSNVSIDLNDYGDDPKGNRYYPQHLDELEPNGMIDWQAKDNIAHEMEDVFLRGASEALTRYIERELHPAIKETLMMSMGYTISYG